MVRVVVAVAVVVAASLGLGAEDDGRTAAGRPPVGSVLPVDTRPEIAIAVRTTERVVALSFDDGPDPRWTPAVLEALSATGARATFFVTGEHVREHPGLARRIVAEGHELANHTDSHPIVETLPEDQLLSEVHGAKAAMAWAGVPTSSWFRPPKGRYDLATVDAVRGEGLEVIGWTVCLERWLRAAPEDGVGAAVARAQPGGIIVAHDGGIPDRSATVAALPDLLARLDGAGYRVVTVTELLRLGPPVPGRPGGAETQRLLPHLDRRSRSR